MIPHKPIFVSAVTKELRSSRVLVAHTLQFLGYPTIEQEIFGFEQGDLRGVLRKKIDRSMGVVQLVGQCYGAEPPLSDDSSERMSYTQYEAEYARRRGKKVWYIVLEPSFPTDPHEAEPEALRQLQARYRARIQSEAHIFHPVHSSESLESHILKYRDDFERETRKAKRWAIAVMMLILAILVGVGWLLWALVISPRPLLSPDVIPAGTRLSVDSGYWARDEVMAVRVSKSTKGTLLGEQPYNLQLEIKNPTTMPIIITRIIVQSMNEDAARLFGQTEPKVCTAEINITHQLDENGSTTVPVMLNQVLPKTIAVQVYHSQSGAPSEFNINLNSTTLPMPPVRYLAREQVFSGYDSAQAIKRGTEAAREWSADAKLVAAFPGDNRVFIDPESRLKYMQVESWVTTFYSQTRNLEYVVIISPEGLSRTEVSTPPEPGDIPPGDIPEPTIGFQEALDLANRGSLLSADWNNIRFGVDVARGKVICAWYLPYRAPDGLPVVIDAISGDRVVPNVNEGFSTIPLRPVPPES